MALPTGIYNAAAVWKLKLYLQNNDGPAVHGVTHEHCVGIYSDVPGFGGSSVASTTPPTVSKIIAAYQSIIGLGTSIMWAALTVSRVKPGVSYAQLAAPAAPIARTTESPIGKIETGGSCLVFRLGTAAGRFAYRIGDFVRDSEITDNQFQVDVSGFTPGAGNLITDLTTATPVTSWENWMQVLLTYTILASYRNGVWVTQPFNSIFYRQVRSRRLGPGFFGNRQLHRI